VRGEAAIRMDAALWALVAELEALKTEREAMIDQGYDEAAFFDLAEQLRKIKERLEAM